MTNGFSNQIYYFRLFSCKCSSCQTPDFGHWVQFVFLRASDGGNVLHFVLLSLGFHFLLGFLICEQTEQQKLSTAVVWSLEYMQTRMIAGMTLVSIWGNVTALECSLGFGGKILQEMCFWKKLCPKIIFTQLQLVSNPALTMIYTFLSLLPAYHLIPY